MLNRFFGVVQEFCTPKNCPSMSAGPGLDYSWLDPNRKPLRLPAPTYIEYVLQWISNRINDETIFPTKAQAVGGAAGAPAAGVLKSGASGQGETWVGKDGGFPQQVRIIAVRGCRGMN